jgi:two-component system alkaline phosphatase synthesis response regulator PhoP
MAYLMVVDDNEDLAVAAALALREEGHEVVTKLDTTAALAEMQNRPPDLVILDVMFPGDDFAGFELARAMCKCPGLNRIPILMLTGVNQELGLKFSTFDIDNSWLPVTDFLEKPVDFGELVNKVKSMLQIAGSLPERTS